MLADLDKQGSPEHKIAPRKRSRRPIDQRNYEQQVEAVLCDLVLTHLDGPGRRLRITRNKRSLTTGNRYQAAFLTEKLTGVLDALKAVGVCTMLLGRHKRASGASASTMTTLRAGAVLLGLLDRFALSRADFGRHPDEEVIVLKGPKLHPKHKPPRIEYQDDEATIRMRSEMQTINRWLETADIEYIDPVDGSARHAAVNDRDRRLQRIFSNARFDHHGRLYGGFWEYLPKTDRSDNIKIDCEPVIALDFGSMGVRLMYAEAGVVPTFEDAYAIPGLEGHRDGVKRLMGAMLNTTKPLKRLPHDIRALLPYTVTIDGQLRAGGAESLSALVMAHHAPIAHLFHQQQGLRGMAMESTIMVRVLLYLIDKGITALPIHDGLLVAESHQATARQAMLDAFEAVTGHTGVVTLD